MADTRIPCEAAQRGKRGSAILALVFGLLGAFIKFMLTLVRAKGMTDARIASEA